MLLGSAQTRNDEPEGVPALAAVPDCAVPGGVALFCAFATAPRPHVRSKQAKGAANVRAAVLRRWVASATCARSLPARVRCAAACCAEARKSRRATLRLLAAVEAVEMSRLDL